MHFPLVNPPQMGVNPPFIDKAIKDPVIILKDGKKMTVKTVIIRHDTLWKFWQGLQVVFMTLLTLGTGLFWWKTLQDKWEQAKTGQEKVTTYTEAPPNPVVVDKVNLIRDQVIGSKEDPEAAKLKAQQEETAVQAQMELDEALAKQLQEEEEEAVEKAKKKAAEKLKMEAAAKKLKEELANAKFQAAANEALVEFNIAFEIFTKKLQDKETAKKLEDPLEIDPQSLTVTVGEKADSSILKNAHQQSDIGNFNLNEIMIVIRNGPPVYYQFVEITAIDKEKKIINFSDGQIEYSKPLVCCYKLSLKTSLKKEFKDQHEITTLLKLAEKAASAHIQSGKFEKAMQIRMQAAKTIPISGPLANIHLQKEDPQLGFRLQSVDTSLIKNQSLTVQRQTFGTFPNQKTQLHVEGKLSHPVRQQMQKMIDYVTQDPEKFFHCLPKGFCKKVQVTTENAVFYGRTERNGKKYEGNFSNDVLSHGFPVVYWSSNGLNYTGSSYKETVIHFEGIAKVRIGHDPLFRTLYNRIQIDLEPGVPEKNAAEKLHVIFASLGLGAVSSSSREEDIERIKTMQVLRAYYPKEAYDFEREATTFEESIESLKNRIMAKVPDMKAKFRDKLHLMYRQEVYSDQSIWAVKGLAQEVRNVGGFGLVAGFNNTLFVNVIPRIISMLKTGPLSAQDRFQAGIITSGASNSHDFQDGSGDYIFARMITKKMSMDPHDYSLFGEVQVLYDLDLVERVGYCYNQDKYGS